MSSSSSLLLSSLELSDTKVYEPYIRALLGTATHFCEVVVLKLRAWFGLVDTARPEDTSQGVWCKPVNFWSDTDQSTRVRQGYNVGERLFQSGWTTLQQGRGFGPDFIFVY